MRKRNKAELIGIVCSDLHLSHKPPIWRSAEPDWYAAMARQLEELSELQSRLDDTPIYCAGDIFDKWNSPAELINFVVENMPGMRSIAGQHDLPNHSIEEVRKSAYVTLIHTNTIWDISERDEGMEGGWRGFAWGQEPTRTNKSFYGVSLIHKYVWIPGCSYPDAPEAGSAKVIAKQYDSELVVCGDNHIPFYDDVNNVFNCGGFYRRNKDQINHVPQVGLVYDDFKVVSYLMDVSADKFIEERESLEITHVNDNIQQFVKELQGLDNTSVDYREAVRLFVNKQTVSKKTREYLTRIIDLE